MQCRFLLVQGMQFLRHFRSVFRFFRLCGFCSVQRCFAFVLLFFLCRFFGGLARFAGLFTLGLCGYTFFLLGLLPLRPFGLRTRFGSRQFLFDFLTPSRRGGREHGVFGAIEFADPTRHRAQAPL